MVVKNINSAFSVGDDSLTFAKLTHGWELKCFDGLLLDVVSLFVMSGLAVLDNKPCSLALTLALSCTLTLSDFHSLFFTTLPLPSQTHD